MKHHGLFFATDLLKLQKIEMEQRDSPKEFHVTFIFKDQVLKIYIEFIKKY